MDTTVLALEMPPADKIRAAFERFGIADDSRIIVYYGNDWVSPSTRVLLTLQYVGLGARASLLDGGLPEWKKGSHPVTAEAPAAAKVGKITPKPTVPVIADADFVKAHINTPGYKIIDARNTMFYDGPIQRPTGNMANGMPRRPIIPNHVPGAANIVFETAFDETNHLLPEVQLRELFTKAGVQPNDKLIAYCHVGQQATVIVYAARTLGYDVQLYDGSFQDWQMRKLPVENSRKDDK
jgi:thiosulfate/3-mercaptopyruvate sulfurtransferase